MSIAWYTRISTDLSAIPEFISYFENELAEAKKEVKIQGNVEKNITALPGLTEHRFNQLQGIEAVLNYLNLQLRKIKTKYFRKYLESYNRTLTSRDAEKFMEGEDEVIDFETLVNSVAYLRNQYLGIIKGFEQKSFALGNISRLRCAGMEDISVG